MGRISDITRQPQFHHQNTREEEHRAPLDMDQLGLFGVVEWWRTLFNRSYITEPIHYDARIDATLLLGNQSERAYRRWIAVARDSWIIPIHGWLRSPVDSVTRSRGRKSTGRVEGPQPWMG